MKTGILCRNAELDAAAPRLNSGTIVIYGGPAGALGTIPATIATAITDQVVRATCTFGSTAFAAASNASIVANAITSDSVADSAGKCSFARLFTSGGVLERQVTVGKTGGTEELLLNTNDGTDAYIAAGGVVSISSLVLTKGEGT